MAQKQPHKKPEKEVASTDDAPSRSTILEEFHSKVVTKDAEGRLFFEAPLTDEAKSILDQLPENPRDWTTRQAGLVGGSIGGTRVKDLVRRGMEFEKNGVPDGIKLKQDDEFVKRVTSAYKKLIDRNDLPDDPADWKTFQAGLVGGSRTRELIMKGYLSQYVEYLQGKIKDNSTQDVVEDETKESGTAYGIEHGGEAAMH